MGGKIGGAVEAPYSLVDMANDAAGLLDAVGISKAHICGRSMGGIIAQEFALNHTDRTLSLTSIYSTTGNPDLPQATPQAMRALMEPAPEEREAYIDYYVEGFKAWAGSGLPFNETFYRNMAAKSFDRCFYPQGTVRQTAAVIAQNNRKPSLFIILTIVLQSRMKSLRGKPRSIMFLGFTSLLSQQAVGN
jgi:pimeloyl-ACP methyl ester carboxylesterase